MYYAILCIEGVTALIDINTLPVGIISVATPNVRLDNRLCQIADLPLNTEVINMANDNTTNTILSSIGSAFGLVGFFDPDEIRAWISLLISCISLVILIVNISLTIYRKIKKAKEDGVVSKDERDDIINELKSGIDDVSESVGDIKDKVQDLKDKKEDK